MPEGPEVHREAQRILKNVGSNHTVQLICDYEPLRRANKTPKVSSRQLLNVHAQGKAILLDFDGGQSIYSHNQLYGKWHFSDDKSSWRFRNRQRRLRLESDKGWAELYSASSVEWLPTSEVMSHPYIQKLGPDALDSDVTKEMLLEHFTKDKFQRKSLHVLLLDQAFVAGLGNYLRSEILYRCSLAPETRVGELNEEELDLLATQTLQIARRSMANPGVALELDFQDWILSHYSLRRNDSRFWVFARAGKDCWVCGDTIEKLEYGNRRLYLCPSCQPHPSRLL